MSNKQILEKAIQKAIDGGWKFNKSDDFLCSGLGLYRMVTIREHSHPYDIIFNHDFAKALFGEGEDHDPGKCYRLETCWHIYDGVDAHDGYRVNRWQYHLQQMVIADDPIEYLGEHL